MFLLALPLPLDGAALANANGSFAAAGGACRSNAFVAWLALAPNASLGAPVLWPKLPVVDDAFESGAASTSSNAANGSAAAATRAGAAASGVLLLPLETRGLNALNGSAGAALANVEPELERALAPKLPPNASNGVAGAAEGAATGDPNASNGDDAAAAGALPNASNAAVAFVDAAPLPNASNAPVEDADGAAALVPNASNAVADEPRLLLGAGDGAAPNASNGVDATGAAATGASSNPNGSFTTLSGLNAMKSLGACFTGDATIGAGAGVGAGAGGALNDADGDEPDDDEDANVAPGGGAILNDPKSLRSAGAGPGVGVDDDDELNAPKSPKPLLLLLLALAAVSKLPKSAKPADALDDAGVSLPNAAKSPNCAKPLDADASELPNASNAGVECLLLAPKKSSLGGVNDALLRELPP